MRDWYFLNFFLLASLPFICVHVVDKIRTHLLVGKTLLQDIASWFVYWDRLSQRSYKNEGILKFCHQSSCLPGCPFYLSICPSFHPSLPPSLCSAFPFEACCQAPRGRSTQAEKELMCIEHFYVPRPGLDAFHLFLLNFCSSCKRDTFDHLLGGSERSWDLLRSWFFGPVFVGSQHSSCSSTVLLSHGIL